MDQSQVALAALAPVIEICSTAGDLRRLLGRALRGRLTALLAGIGVTLALQSSTATASMTASFVAGGMIGLTPALAVMLGANVGSALVSYALSFDITLIYRR